MKNTFKLLSIALFLACTIGCNNDDDTLVTENQSQNSAAIARAFYQEVIINKNMAKFNSYIGKSYVQHATGYEDGVEPLRAELQANAESNNTIEILRVVGDQNYAALHSLWTIGTQQILYVDIWRVENGKLVEHWDQFQNVVPSTLHNNTMYTGPDVNPLAIQDKEQNRQKAIAVLKVFDNLNDLSPINNYISDNYIQHNPTVADGKTGILTLLNDLQAINYQSQTTIAKTLAMGDMVFIHSKVIDLSIPNDKGTGAIDIFRFDTNGKIVEHWDVLEPLTGNSLNTNDPFFYPN